MKTIKAAFWVKLTRTLEELPELLSHLPQNTVVQTQSMNVETAQQTEELPEKSPISVEVEQKKIEEETGCEFIRNFFGDLADYDYIEQILDQDM